MRTHIKKVAIQARQRMSILDIKQPIHFLSTELENNFGLKMASQQKDITGYKAWFSQEGVPP